MKNNQALISLHRYFIWANRLRDYFDNAIKNHDLTRGIKWADEPGLFMSHWYGALYIVIEGWQELNLHDPIIDQLLQSPNVELLKRFRNGAFHFQKKYWDKRFTEFWKDSQDTVPWVRELNRAFGEFFLAELQKVRKEK